MYAIPGWIRSCRSEHGSNVAQAAAVAILAAGLIAALAMSSTTFSPAVSRAFTCVVAALGGDTGCQAGQADGGSAAPANNLTQPTSNGSGRDGWGWTAGSIGLDVIPVVGEIKGLIEVFTGTDLVTGEDLGWWRFAGLAGLVGLNEIKFLRYGDDVVEAGSDVLRRGDDIVPPCRIGFAPTKRTYGLGKPLPAPCFPGKPGGYQSRAEFDAGTRGVFASPEEADVAWQAYQSNLRSTGMPVIGRQVDTHVASEWPDHNILNVQGWTLNVNDAWIQAGIDRRARFYLGSPLTDATLKHPIYGETVFKRELDQLLRAGYRQEGDYMIPPP